MTKPRHRLSEFQNVVDSEFTVIIRHCSWGTTKSFVSLTPRYLAFLSHESILAVAHVVHTLATVFAGTVRDAIYIKHIQECDYL